MAKNIGLCIAYKNSNYGTLLQAFATQHIIEKLGCNTEIINYVPGWDRGLIFSPESVVYELIHKTKQKITSIKENKKEKTTVQVENIKQRNEIGSKFCKNHLHNIVRINGKSDLIRESRKYDVVMVGSDQMWDPTAGFFYFYSLMFVAEGVKRVSYATSLGVDRYPWYVYRQAKRFLKRIDYLSVREKQGAEIIKKVSGRDAKVVLDPVYLISKNEWETIIPYQDNMNGEPYVLSYFLGDNPKMKKMAYEFAHKNGLKVISILSDEVLADDRNVTDYSLTNQTPEEFVNLIRNAEFIFTDSFHGFAFSVINEKQVFVTYRVRKNLKSRNSRIDNILSLLSLEDRLIFANSDTKRLNNMIDYSCTTRKLVTLRDHSLFFLKTALDVNN